MTLYHECFNREGSLEEKMVMYHDRIARKLIAELEAVIAEPPWLGPRHWPSTITGARCKARGTAWNGF